MDQHALRPVHQVLSRLPIHIHQCHSTANNSARVKLWIHPGVRDGDVDKTAVGIMKSGAGVAMLAGVATASPILTVIATLLTLLPITTGMRSRTATQVHNIRCPVYALQHSIFFFNLSLSTYYPR